MLRERDHSYWVGAERVLGATESLKELGILDDRWYDDRGTERGLAVHQFTETVDRKRRCAKLRARLGSEGWLGYADSWQQFVDAYALDQILIEVPLWCPVRRIAGQPDRVAVVRRAGFPMHLGVIDMKTGDLEPWHGFQLSIYDIVVQAWLRSGRALRLLPTLPRVNYGVYLREDGGFPRVRTFPFDPVTHSLIAAAQAKRALHRTR